MKRSKMTSAIALVMILFASSCSTMEDPLSQDMPAAFEIAMDEVRANTNRMKIELNGNQGVDCQILKTADPAILEMFTPGEKVAPRYGETVAQVTYEDGRTKLAVFNLVKIRESETMQIQGGGAGFEMHFNHADFEVILLELCRSNPGGSNQVPAPTASTGIVPMLKGTTADVSLPNLLNSFPASSSTLSPTDNLLDQLSFLHGSWELETDHAEEMVRLSWERSAKHLMQGNENYLNPFGDEQSNEWYVKQEGNNLKLIIATQHVGEVLIMENGAVEAGKVTFTKEGTHHKMLLELKLSEQEQMVIGIETSNGDFRTKGEYAFNRTGN